MSATINTEDLESLPTMGRAVGVHYVKTFDGHPSMSLRDNHNANVIFLLLASAFDIAFFVYYCQSAAIVLFAIFGMFLPLILNYVWLLVDYEKKLKSIRNYNAVIGLFIYLGLLGTFQFGLLLFLGFSVFEGGMSTTTSPSYQMGAMWVTENLFLMLVASLSMFQLFTFCMHVHVYRKFVTLQLIFNKK